MVEKDHCEKTEKACDADQEQPIRSGDGFVGEWVLWIGFFFFGFVCCCGFGCGCGLICGFMGLIFSSLSLSILRSKFGKVVKK